MFYSQRLTIPEQDVYLARLTRSGYTLTSTTLVPSGRVLLYKKDKHIVKLRVMNNGWLTVLA